MCIANLWYDVIYFFFRFKKPNYLSKGYGPWTDCLCASCVVYFLRTSPDVRFLVGSWCGRFQSRPFHWCRRPDDSCNSRHKGWCVCHLAWNSSIRWLVRVPFSEGDRFSIPRMISSTGPSNSTLRTRILCKSSEILSFSFTRSWYLSSQGFGPRYV